jgi:hypothetical protein
LPEKAAGSPGFEREAYLRERKSKAAWVVAALAAAAALLLGAAGCGQYQPGEPFREPADESFQSQATPVEAVQKWLKSMEWKDRQNPDEGKDFDAFVEVSAPALFPEGTIADPEEMQKLRDLWNSRDWEAEFKDLEFETYPKEAENPDWEGDEATVRIVSGQVRYIGKEMFDTNEYKVESFKDKPGEVVLRKLDGKWRVMGARVIGDGDSWSVQ